MRLRNGATEEDYQPSSSLKLMTIRPVLIHSLIAGISKPTLAKIGAFQGYSLPIYSSDNEELFMTMRIPDRWDGETNIHFRLSCALGGAEDVGDKFKMNVATNSYDPNNSVVPATENDVPCEMTVVTGRASQYAPYECTDEIDCSSISPGDIMGIHITRIAASASEVTNEIIVIVCTMEVPIVEPYGIEWPY